MASMLSHILFSLGALLSSSASTSQREIGNRTSQQIGSNAVMIVSGITGEAEYCLSVANGDASLDGAALGLERCGASAASGDGRDVFTLQAGGASLLMWLAGGAQ